MQSTQKPLKIAIIEDSKDFADVVAATLAEDTVIRFKEVADFVDKEFDLILCDLRLRETWGHDTIIALRQKTDLPMIALTGLGGPLLKATDMQTLMQAGCNEVYNKEIITDPGFPMMIRSFLEKYRAAKGAA